MAAQAREDFADKIERTEDDERLAGSGARRRRREEFGDGRAADLAAEVGRPGAARAIGRANATNPICVIVPCHRVIRSDGSLTGFAYGTTIKRQLLELEGALPPALL